MYPEASVTDNLIRRNYRLRIYRKKFEADKQQDKKAKVIENTPNYIPFYFCIGNTRRRQSIDLE